MKTFLELLEETKEFTHENRALSWFHLLFTFLVIAVSCYATTVDSLPMTLRLISSLVMGLTIVRGFIIYHDYQHGAIFRASKPAKWILSVYGVLVLNPPSIWKRSHNYHHKNNSQIVSSSIGSFPIMNKLDYMNAKTSTKILYRLARNPLTILFGYFTIFIIGMCLKSFLKDPKRHADSAIALVVNLALTIYVAQFGAEIFFLSFFIPLFISCAAGAYLFYIQHNFPDMKLKPRTEWSYLFAALYSSSYMEASWLMHWFTGNIGYHHVHHLNPLIPFYNLPRAMAAVPELQNPGRTSLMPYDIYKCFKLKLWDEMAQKMVSFDQAFNSVEILGQAN
ncbi:MAG: fatty acid desaturase [Xanthomonadaceae bacterium]|nr:fatty acid desaturase [Xanthomonadaceae bacterium]